MFKRHFPQYVHILVASVILLGVIVLLYQIVARHNFRLDLTEQKLFTLKKQTIKTVKQMKPDEIQIHAFYAEEDPMRRKMEGLFEGMAAHHPRFQYNFYDPDRSPSEARKYQVDSYRTTVIEYQERQERTNESGEEAITNALIRIAHPQSLAVCFTGGHGENSLSDPDRGGLNLWKQTLENHQYRVKDIQLMQQGIPTDCNLVMLQLDKGFLPIYQR